MNRRRLLLALSLILIGGAVSIVLWRQATSEPLASFRDFPHTYLTESGVGYDPLRIVIGRGSITGEPSIPDPASGATAWPAYCDPTGTIVPLQDGRPFLIPLIAEGSTVRTPVIAPLRRTLNGKEIAMLMRYQTAEGAALMDAFRTEFAP